MAHVGIERLGAGHRQHDRAQRQEGERRVEREEADRPDRVERAEDLRMCERCW